MNGIAKIAKSAKIADIAKRISLPLRVGSEQQSISPWVNVDCF